MNSPKQFQDSVANAINDRKKRNPAYSLRAFAQSIGVTPSHLSMILNKKKFPSPDLVERIGEAIEVPAGTIETWQKEIREQKKSFFFHGPVSEYNELQPGDYSHISKWYHYAIIELFKTKNFKSSYSFIADQIGIDVPTAVEAVSALEQNEIVTTETTPWSVISKANTNITDKRTTLERRQLQKDLLEISIGAIDNIEPEERDHSSMTMAIHTDRIPEAKEMIKKFRRELCEFLTSEGQGDSVYHLTLGLFPTVTDDKD